MKKEKRIRSKMSLHPAKILGRLLVWAYGLVLIVPIGFAVITAFKTGVEITLNPVGLPEKLQWGNFVEAFRQAGLLRAMWNSVYTSVAGLILLMFNTVMLSYCCHRLRDYKIGTFMYMLILAGLLIPKVGAVSTITLYRSLHIYDTHLAVILGAAIGNIPFGVFIVSGFLRTVPKELEEAAQIDGCSDFKLLFRVLVPVTMPALVTVGIFSFCGTWNSVTGPLLYIRTRELYTIPMALLTFTSTHSTQYEYLFAGILATAIPIVIAYVFCQKYFVQSLAGSVKG